MPESTPFFMILFCFACVLHAPHMPIANELFLLLFLFQSKTNAITIRFAELEFLAPFNSTRKQPFHSIYSGDAVQVPTLYYYTHIHVQ